MTDDEMIEKTRAGWLRLGKHPATPAIYEAADRIEKLEAEVERLTLTVRKLQGHQGALETDNARLQGLLREAEVKLTDVQGAYATKQYSANLLTRIRAALAGDSHDQ